mmetsp:Transcript_124085/g.247168  ORF Transcript_124085/g.247168 Transcript_124085/m.247168 type:complete len:136 (+) Transcript_124085:1537-1944(+)
MVGRQHGPSRRRYASVPKPWSLPSCSPSGGLPALVNLSAASVYVILKAVNLSCVATLGTTFTQGATSSGCTSAAATSVRQFVPFALAEFPKKCNLYRISSWTTFATIYAKQKLELMNEDVGNPLSITLAACHAHV